MNHQPEARRNQWSALEEPILWHEQELHKDTELILSPALTESTRTAPLQNLKYNP